MTERNEVFGGEVSPHHAMPQAQREYLSTLVAGIGVELEPTVLVGLEDFHALALRQFGNIHEGGRAFASLLRVAQDQNEDNRATLSPELPAIIFRQKPEGYVKQPWYKIKEQFGQLELTSLKSYVDVVSRIEADATSRKDLERLYSKLGTTVGRGKVRFWRDMVAEHIGDEPTL